MKKQPNPKCPDPNCGYELVSQDYEFICLQCGKVTESCYIQNENNKIIEEKGVAKRVLINSFNPSSHSFLINSDTNYKRQKKIRESLILCEKEIPLQKDEREDIEQLIEKYLKNTKEACHNIKALVASVFYLKCSEKKRHIKLKEFLLQMNIKSKHFLKFTENLKKNCKEQFGKILPQILEDKDKNNFEEIFQKLFEKIALFLNTRKQDQKNFDMITNLYKPPSNHHKNQENMSYIKFGESNELMNKTKKLFYGKAKALYLMPEIKFLKNGKSPMNFITAIIVLILKSMDLRLTKNEFASLFEIPYCTLSRIIKEIEECILERFGCLQKIDDFTKEKKSEGKLEKVEIEEEKSNFESEKESPKSRKQSKGNGRKTLLNYIFKNIQCLSENNQNFNKEEVDQGEKRDLFNNILNEK